MGRDTSARHHRAFHRTVGDAISRQFHEAVVDQYFGPWPNVPSQSLISHGNLLRAISGQEGPGADLSAGSQGHRPQSHALSDAQFQCSVDLSDANARPLQILNNRHRHTQAVSGFANGLDCLAM